MKHDANPFRVLRMKQLASSPNSTGLLPVSASTIWRWIKEGAFPAGHKIGLKTTIWYECEVRAWLEEQSEISPDETNT